MRGMLVYKLIWGWPATVILAVCALGAMALVLLVPPETTGLRGDVVAAAVDFFHLLLLVAAGLMYLNWRLSGDALSGWLTLAWVMLSVPHTNVAGMLVADSTQVGRGLWWPLLTRVAVASALLVLVLLAARLGRLPDDPVPVDPLVAGLVAGLCSSAVGLAIVRWTPDLDVPTQLVVVLSLLPGLLFMAATWMMVRRASLSGSTRFRLCLGVVLVTWGQVDARAGSPLPPGRALTLVLSTIGTVMLCHVALAMIRTTVREHRRQVAQLYARLIVAESTERDNRARLHEVASTVAGLTSVSRLIHAPNVALAGQHRSLLEHTLEAELGRLGRLTMGETDTRGVFSLDDVLRQLVVTQHAQGHRVTWEPSGHRVTGRADDLAEALHVLLDNAAKHGGNAGVTVGVRQRAGVVEILVADRGPGLDSDIRAHAFDWGISGQDSKGQGIGLAIARDLVEQQGGYLTLDDSPQPGTTFIVGLLVEDACDTATDRAV